MNRFAKLWTALFLALCLHVSLSHAQVQIQGPRASADAFSGVVYGPIDSSDTLWRIASRYKQDSEFTVFQTMLAIYQLNPRAFENGNFNTMIDGAILQLPSDSYIARIDPQRARAKAEADERSYAARVESLQPNNNVSPESAEQSPVETASDGNLKDSPPLVNQEDLSNTQRQLQNQLNALNRQQNTQFEAVKDQVSASIENVQSLIEENKKLYDRLDQVNNDIADLRSRVEGEMQSQIDEQLAMQRELLELIKAEQAKEAEAADSDWIKTLTSPTGLIVISTTGTLAVLGLVAYLLLRRKPEEQDAPVQQQTEAVEELNAVEDIIDDELVIGEAIDEIDEDADELLKALSEDSEEDDVLSEQLEDGLDEIKVDNDLDDFAALEDEMLVPDSPAETETDNAVDDAAESPVNFDAEAISLDEDDDFDNQSIDLSSDGEIADQAVENPDSDENQKESQAINKIAVDTNSSEVPEGIQLNEDGEVDDNTIEMIGQRIQEKDAEITQLTNEILEEIESAELESAESEPSDLLPTEVDELSAMAEESGLDESIASDVAAQLEGTVEAASSTDLEDTSKADVEDILKTDNAAELAQELEQELAKELDQEIAQEVDSEIPTEPDKTLESNNTVADENTSNTEDSLATAEDEILATDDSSDSVETDAEAEADVADDILESVDDILESVSEQQEDAQVEPGTTDQAVSSEDSNAIEAVNEPLEDVPVESASAEADSTETTSDSTIELDTSTEDKVAETVDDDIDNPDIISETKQDGEHADSEDTLENESESIDALSDEITEQLEDDVIADEELDSLLDEFTAEMEANALEDEPLESSDEPDAMETGGNLADELTADEALQNEDNDALSEELLNELEGEVETTAELDSLLDEITETEPEDIDVKENAEQQSDVLPNNDEAVSDASLPVNEEVSAKGEAPSNEEDKAMPEVFAETDPGKEEVLEDSDDDILADLPEIDDWQDSTEDSAEAVDIQIEPEVESTLQTEDSELEDEQVAPSQSISEHSPPQNIDKPEVKPTQGNPLDEAGLDLDALMTDKEDPDFTNVDDLLAESESFPPLSDDDLELNLDGSLDKLMEPTSDDFEFSSENYQASNLDLAQIYIDMEDFESATDVLQEVLESGNTEQQKEAQSLLKEIEKA